MSGITLGPVAGRPGRRFQRLADAPGIWLLAILVGAAITGVSAAAMPMLPMGIVAIGVSTYAFLRYPWLVMSAILLLRAAIDSSGGFVLAGGTNPIGAMNSAIVLGGGLALLLSGRKLPAPILTYPFIAFLLLGAASLRSSLLPEVGFQSLLPLAALFVLFCWAALLAREERDLLRFCWLTMLSAPIPLLVSMYQAATGTAAVTKDGQYHVVNGTFSFANGFAFYCMVLFALGILLMRHRTTTTTRRLYIIAIMGLATVSIFLTYTRSAWVTLPLVILIMGVLHFRRLLTIVAISGAVTLLVAPVLATAVEDRFSDLGSSSSGSDQSSWAWRTHNWSGMVMYANDKPLTGYGLGSYKWLTWERFGSFERNFAQISSPELGIVAHNDYLDMAVELGIPGLALWVWILLTLTFLAWRARAVTEARPYAATAFAIMVAFLIVSGVDNLQGYSATTFYPIVLIGALEGVRRTSQERATALNRPSSDDAPLPA